MKLHERYFVRRSIVSSLWRAASASSVFVFALCGCSSDDDSTPDGGMLDGAVMPDANCGQRRDPEGGPITVNRPELVPATEDRIAGLKVPDGFQVNVFARDLAGAACWA
jgi:hypothetical protein